MALMIKEKHLQEKLAKIKAEMAKLDAYAKPVLASPDEQFSLTDPDSRSSCLRHAFSLMATSGRGSGGVGYKVQTAVDTENHLLIAHELTNSGAGLDAGALFADLTATRAKSDFSRSCIIGFGSSNRQLS